MKKYSFLLPAIAFMAVLFLLPTQSYSQPKVMTFLRKAEKTVTDIKNTTEKAQALNSQVRSAKTQVDELTTSLTKKEESTPMFGGSKKSSGDLLSIKIQNTDYMGIMGLSEFLENQKYVKELEYSFSENTGLIELIHNSKTNQILPELIKNSGYEMKVVSVQNDAIEIALK